MTPEEAQECARVLQGIESAPGCWCFGGRWHTQPCLDAQRLFVRVLAEQRRRLTPALPQESASRGKKTVEFPKVDDAD